MAIRPPVTWVMSETALYACGVIGGCAVGALAVWAGYAVAGWSGHTWEGEAQLIFGLCAFLGIAIVERNLD